MASTSTSTVKGHPGVPRTLADANMHRQMIADAVNRHNAGKFNATIDVTLNANTGATIIADNRIGYNSAICPLMPMTLSGAAAVAAGMWFDAITAAVNSTSATITCHHQNSAHTDKTIRFGIIG